MEDDIVSQKLELLRKKDEQAFNEFSGAFETGSCKKGEILIPMYKTCDRLYVVESGIAKQFRHKEDGSEYITWFSFKGDLLTAYTSFVTQEPSKEAIKIIEDCEYISISRDKCYALAEKYHAVETFFRELLEIYYIQSDERLFFLQSFTAKQKYNHILKEMPHFLQRLPQKRTFLFFGNNKRNT